LIGIDPLETQMKQAPSVIRNKKARREYDITEAHEAGIVLAGSEVKSIRAGRCDIQDSYCDIEEGEVWVYNMYVAPYEQAGVPPPPPRRKRKLLLHKDEIRRLYGKVTERGLTLIPLTLYFKDGRAKLEIGIARGKRLYDKREAIKRRDLDREMQQEQSHRRTHE
jgi:SsrA-binding protein